MRMSGRLYDPWHQCLCGIVAAFWSPMCSTFGTCTGHNRQCSSTSLVEERRFYPVWWDWCFYTTRFEVASTQHMCDGKRCMQGGSQVLDFMENAHDWLVADKWSSDLSSFCYSIFPAGHRNWIGGSTQARITNNCAGFSFTNVCAVSADCIVRDQAGIMGVLRQLPLSIVSR